MQRTLSLLALLGLLFGLLPPATCLGIGRACCCASPTTTLPTAPAAPSPGHQPTALSAQGSACGCACPELSACPADPPLATRAISPRPVVAPFDTAPAPSPRAALATEHFLIAAHRGADPDPPPASPLALLCCLRI